MFYLLILAIIEPLHIDIQIFVYLDKCISVTKPKRNLFSFSQTNKPGQDKSNAPTHDLLVYRIGQRKCKQYSPKFR